MYLKSLELSGFKSFAKKTELSFGAPITAVVGPNGSGKSNIVEAFSFVLGEQSLKSMRGKRGEDLIWNGSSPAGGGARRSNRASVKIVFDNSKRLLNVDFDEVSIERVVYRDSISEYLINGTVVRLKDVIELLANARIGASGYHIISQGEADHILLASSKERREMIEDALGLKIYQYKKRESERKLEKTRENITRAESLRKEIAPHLRFLKKQVEKVEKTIQQKEELRRLYKEYIKRENFYIEAKTAELDSERKEPEEKLKKLEGELASAKRILSESPGVDKKRDEVIAVEGKLNEIRIKRDALSREAGRLEGELGGIVRIKDKAKKDATRADDAPIPLSKVRNLAGLIEKEIATAEKSEDLGTIRAIFSKIKALFHDFIESHRAGVFDEISNYEQEIAALANKRKTLETEIGGLKKEEENLYKDYNRLKASIETEKDKSRDAEKKMFQLMAEQKEVYAALSIIKDKENRLALLKDELEREMREGALLLGRGTFDFTKQNFTDESGKAITREVAAAEARAAQEERLRLIQKIKIRIEDAGLSGGDDVLKEYREVGERDAFLEKELADLEQSSASLEKLIEELDEKLTFEFKTGVSKINAQFEAFFTLMFGGGKAAIRVIEEIKQKRESEKMNTEELELTMLTGEEDGEAKPEVGIEIDVKLPRKNIKGLEMLSGGERALTSIALIFAISQVNPPPFIVLDETDAALDEANSRKYGDMIEDLAKLSQLILITHNRETMSRAGVLYGVTMGGDGVSKLLSVAFDEAVAVAN
jgi:chromosome segregation protein